MRYVKGLDTIRAFAVLLVLYWHFVRRHNINNPLGIFEQLFLPSGAFGVTLFFVLSGFLITRILLQAREESDDKMLIIRNFIIRRALRIFPIFYLLVILLLFVGYPFTEGELPYVLTYTSNLFMFKNMAWSNFGHSWSLSIEEQFYLIWPWLVIFLKKEYLKHIFIAAIAIGILSSFCVSQLVALDFASPAEIFTTSCFDAFGIGALYAYFVVQKTDTGTINRALIPVLIIALLFSFYWKVCPYISQEPHLYFLVRSVNSIISITIIHFVLTNKSILLKKYLLESRILNLIGKISYSMYLFHYPLGIYLKHFVLFLMEMFPTFPLLKSMYIHFIIKFMIVFIISLLSFELIEKRFLRLKNLFTYKK